MLRSARAAVQEAIDGAGVSPDACGGVGFGGAFHSVMAVDRAGEPLTGVITWVDGRAVSQAEAVRKAYGPHEIYQQTGCPVHSMFPLYKLIWLREERPEIFDAGRPIYLWKRICTGAPDRGVQGGLQHCGWQRAAEHPRFRLGHPGVRTSRDHSAAVISALRS